MHEGEPDPEQIRDGATEAFDALFARYAPRVAGYLLRLTGDRSTAEDLTQETFLAAFVGRRAYAGRSRPLAWLLGIAARRWRDRLRSERRVETLDQEPESAVSGPEAQAVARLTLEAALARLEAPQREAFLLVAAQGLRYDEAARALEEPIGTVKWRVHEATKRLRLLLSEEERDGSRENPCAPARSGRR